MIKSRSLRLPRRLMPTLFLFIILVPLGISTTSLQARTKQQSSRPNILLIITDDQRFDSIDFMPHVKQRIYGQGIGFTNAYVTTPLCCPSRASILTGLFARHHGVHVNEDQLTKPTFVKTLHDAGYYTGLVGKYLNSLGKEKRPLPEYDYWAASQQVYIDPAVNLNGRWMSTSGHQTYILRDFAQSFLEQADQLNQPFLLIFAPRAPHLPAIPAPGDETLYPDLPVYRPPSHNEADVSDKPNWVQQLPLYSSTRITAWDQRRKEQLQTLHGADLAVDSLLTTLEEQGKLDTTLVIFLSDNGYLYAEHRLGGKQVPYQEAVRVPFALRYPPLVRTPRTDNHLVANIDIAPTILDLAGLPIPADIDGRSLRPLLERGGTWRDELLLEGWQTPNSPAVEFTGIQTSRWVYVEVPDDLPELYDLQADPYQTQNLVHNSAYDTKEAEMRNRLLAYQISNLIRNEGFGWDTNNDRRPDSWRSDSRFTRTTAVIHNGSYAGQHSATDNSTYTIGQTVVNLAAGQTYRFSGWVNIPVTSDAFSLKLQVNWRDANDATLGTKLVRLFSDDTDGGWSQARATIVAPAGASSARVQMVVSSLNATIYVDDFVFGPLLSGTSVLQEP
jgi:N-acetylglucosamine-6-sulfatase